MEIPEGKDWGGRGTGKGGCRTRQDTGGEVQSQGLVDEAGSLRRITSFHYLLRKQGRWWGMEGMV